MALMTFLEMQNEVRDTIQDADANNLSIDAATLKRVINRCYSHIRGFNDGRIYYVPSVTSGAFIAPQVGSMFKTLLETNYRRILECYPADTNAGVQPFGPALGRMEQWELFAMQREDPTDRQVFGSYYSTWRQGTTTAANVGKFNFAVWPLSSITYDYVLGVLKEVTALSADSDKADAIEEEMHFITDMASAIGARWLGRNEETIAQIQGRLPEELQTASEHIRKDMGLVKPRIGQEVA